MTMALLLMGAASAGDQHVLVRADAKLYSQPDGDDDATKVTKAVDLEADPHRVLYANLMGREDGWVQLRTTSHRAACTKALGQNAPLGLILYVKPDELVNVLTRPVEISNGATRVSAWSGLPVYDNVDATLTVAVKDLKVTGPFPRDAMGQTFVPSEPPRTEFQPLYGATGTFGDAKIKIEAEGSPADQSGGGWTLERRCLTATGPQVNGAAPVKGAGQEGGGGSAHRTQNAVVLEPGTVLRWPDGVYAGTLEETFRLSHDPLKDVTGMKCGTVMKGLDVCVDDPAVDGDPALRYVAQVLKPKDSPAVKHPKGDVKGETAKCKAQVDVNKKGETTSVDARMCAEPFEKAVEEALMTWTWIPHKVGGEAVNARTWTWVTVE